MPLCKQCFCSESNESSMSSVIGVSSVYSVIHNVNSDTSPSSLSSMSSASSLRSNASSISGVIFINEWRVGANNHSKQNLQALNLLFTKWKWRGGRWHIFFFLLAHQELLRPSRHTSDPPAQKFPCQPFQYLAWGCRIHFIYLMVWISQSLL